MADYNWDYGAEYEPEYWSTGGGYSGTDPSLGGWGYDPSTGQFSNTPMYEGGAPGGGGWGYDPSTGQFSQTPISGSEGGGGGNWLSSILGSLGSLGPLLQAGGALAGGMIGSNAASDAAGLQANALNRGLDLQTAQWLQQQANQAPWLQAGQQALPQLMRLAGQEPPAAFQGPPSISGQGYALPQSTPTWGPQTYQGPQYGPGSGGGGGAGGNMAPPGGGVAGVPNVLANVDWSGAGQKGQGGGDADAMMLHGGGGGGMTSGATQGGGTTSGATAGGGGTGGQVPWYGDYRYTPGQVPRAAANRWTPGQVPRAAAHRWTPGQGPQAAQYRYTPGQTPDAAAFESGPPQLYQGAMPGTQVSQLTGQQVLDQDPGAAFRQSEARKALEGSAAAKGGLLSGSTLGALQRQSQDLASQEYGNAWQRMMARDTEQYGRDWGQYQQAWNQGVQGTQLGLQTNAQNFGQALSASQLREQVHQVAAQQGWSQAQTEAAFREQMAQQASQQGWEQQMGEVGLREQLAQQASQQGWGQQMGEAGLREQMAQLASQQGFGQALAGQGQAWNQGLQAQQWAQQQRQAYDQSVYDRMMQQSGLRYGRDVAQNETDYQRMLAAYNSRQQNQNTQWNRWAGLAGVGQTAANQLGETGAYTQRNLSSLLAQLGQAQGMGAAGSGAAWSRALGGGTNAMASLLANLNS